MLDTDGIMLPVNSIPELVTLEIIVLATEVVILPVALLITMLLLPFCNEVLTGRLPAITAAYPAVAVANVTVRALALAKLTVG